MTLTPCRAPEANPEDWFIRSDGRQYVFEDFLTEAERAGVARSVLPIGGETAEEHDSRVASALRAAIANRKRAALARRRHAREACEDCPIRITCLEGALARGEIHGTWGGLFEEQIAEVHAEARRRGRRVRPLTT